MKTIGLSHSASEKLARFILDWCAEHDKGSGEIRAKLTLTHEEIAQMIGARPSRGCSLISRKGAFWKSRARRWWFSISQAYNSYFLTRPHSSAGLLKAEGNSLI
jgi:hypothetical protein